MEGDDVEAEVPRASSRHIKKRALRNKALTISFNEKDLSDYVTGFHKRKKKRRKEAQQKLMEKERLRRIEKRRKMKEEREFVQYGGALPVNNPGHKENSSEIEEDEETEQAAPVSGTRMYDNEDMTITVTTSEISHEAAEDLKGKTLSVPSWRGETKNKHGIPAAAKQCKHVAKNRSLPRMKKKRDKQKGKKGRNKL